MKPQKYWNCKVFLYLKLTTTTYLNFLFVLYFWSSYCRCLKKSLIKWWDQFINNHPKSTVGRPMNKQFVLSFYLGILIWWQVKGSMILMNVLPDVYLCPHLSWGDTKTYTSGSIASSQRMPTEINKSNAIAKITISVDIDTVKRLKAFRINSTKMPISLPILSLQYLVVCIFRYFFNFHMSLRCFKSLCSWFIGQLFSKTTAYEK